MIINIGDTIRDKRGREGVITNIGIATEPNDIAAENDTALNARTYDTDLKYTGAITFNSYWCYFGQIEEVIKKNEVRTDWDADWDDIIDPSDPPEELNK